MKISLLRHLHRFITLPLIIAWIMIPTIARAQAPFEECSETEAWVPVGTGLQGHAVVATEMNGKLYTIYSLFNQTPSGPEPDTVFVLARLDGETWTVLTDFKLEHATGPELVRITDMVAYNGNLYLAGNFSSLNGIDSSEGIARWDGRAWTAVPGNTLLNGNIRNRNASVRMAAYNDELIVSGAFGTSWEDVDWGIAAFDGSAWRKIGKASRSEDTLLVSSFVEWRGELIAAGPKEIEGIQMRGIARWNGTSWSPLSTDRYTVTQLAAHDDWLYIMHQQSPSTQGAIERWNGSIRENLRLMPSRYGAWSWSGTPSVAIHNGELYMLAGLTLGLSPNTRDEHIAVRWDGTAFQQVANLNEAPAFLIEYGGQLLAGGIFTRSCSMIVNHVARLCETNECGGIAGRVVEAFSGDCGDLAAKPGIAHNIIEIDPGPRYAITDSTGNYRFRALPGSYKIRSFPPRHYQQLCPADDSTQSVEVATTAGKSIHGVNFAHTPIPNIRDMDVSMTASRPRVGIVMRFTLTCINRGTTTVERSVVRLDVSPLLKFDRADSGVSVQTPSMLEWTLHGIERGERRTVNAYFLIPSITPLNARICAMADVDAGDITLDAHPAWNFDTLCALTLNSYDPNDIAVAPGVGTEGWLYPHDTVLTYTIRFQNNGNDTAYKVTVVTDTLSPHLQFTSLSFGTTSHHPDLSFGKGGSIIWTFNNIDLPASETNEAESQGYLKYSIRLKRGLIPYTEIMNRASIYFDYNEAVITNTVRSTLSPDPKITSVDAPDESPMHIYPNPTRGVVYISGEISRGSIVRVENMLGEVVYMNENNGEGMMIDLGGFPAGIYFITHAGMRTRIIKQ